MHLFSQNIGRLERKHHINGEGFSSWLADKLNVIIFIFFFLVFLYGSKMYYPER